MKEWHPDIIIIIIMAIVIGFASLGINAKINQVAYNNSIAEAVNGAEKMTFGQALWFTILADNNNN